MSVRKRNLLLIVSSYLFIQEAILVEGTDCPEIDPIRYGNIITSSPPPYTVGTVAKFSCDVGFKGSGKSSISCLGDGKWSGSVPFCTAFVCQRKLKRVEEGRKCKKKCKKDMDCKGSFKKCECDDWCGKSCININAECQHLKDPINGYIVGNSRTYGHTVTYGCEDGFTLTGPSTRRCRSDKKWSGVAPRCVPFSACGQTAEDKKSWAYGKVTKGSNSKQGAWPWQVLLMFAGDYSVDQIYNTASGFGGGSVINDEWILSAAHVFEHLFPRNIAKNSWDNTFLLVMGMTKFPRKGLVIPDHIQIFKPKSVYLHPKFVARSFDYDVALIRSGGRMKPNDNNELDIDGSNAGGKLTYSRFVRAVCLPCIKGDRLKPVDILMDYTEEECSRDGWINDVSSVMVTGFGKLSHGSTFSPVNLQEGLLRIEPVRKCVRSVMEIQQESTHVRFTSSMFCASGIDESAKVDSCQGDSGGPVVKQLYANKDVVFWMQIGIVSWGVGCGGHHPGFYASVPSVMDWIWNTLNSSLSEITCRQLNLTSNTELAAGSCPATRQVGSVCRVHCTKNFKFAGTQRNEYDLRCALNQDGLTASWSPTSLPHCEAILCEQRYLPNPNHYNIASCPSGRLIGSKCLLQCKNGYPFKNKNDTWTITCKLQSDFKAEWDIENIPTCEARFTSDGWYRFTNGYEYKYISQKATYDVQTSTCSSMDPTARLASEAARSGDLSSFDSSAVGVPYRTMYFVGGSDAGTEGTWVFQDSVVMASGDIATWAAPPLAQPNGGTAENCLVWLHAFASVNGLADGRCAGPFSAMCERPIP